MYNKVMDVLLLFSSTAFSRSTQICTKGGSSCNARCGDRRWWWRERSTYSDGKTLQETINQSFSIIFSLCSDVNNFIISDKWLEGHHCWHGKGKGFLLWQTEKHRAHLPRERGWRWSYTAKDCGYSLCHRRKCLSLCLKIIWDLTFFSHLSSVFFFFFPCLSTGRFCNSRGWGGRTGRVLTNQGWPF